MDKRADIPVSVLVVGVFLICSIALLSFFSFNLSLKNSFDGLSLVEKVNLQTEEREFNGEEIIKIRLTNTIPKLSWKGLEKVLSVSVENVVS